MVEKRNLIVGGTLAAAVTVFMLVGLFYTPYDPEAMDLSMKFAPASFAHLFGCDQFGRDVLSRVLQGSGTTFLVAAGTLCIGGGLGTLLGLFTGYFGGWPDEMIMRFNDLVVAFPSILLALIFISLLGPGKYNVILALGIVFIPSFARIVRSQVIVHKDMDYVKSARLMGAGRLRTLFVHILPNIRRTLFSALAIGFNNAVLSEAGMSYLGIGVQPPDASIGRMMSEAQAYIFTAPWSVLFPGAVMILMVLGFGLLSDGWSA
ncbi:MAG: ABC transporter permease [Lachnospiraceae bacterium]|nr:ABC transporter permease [Lachnospiraceae bacterium]MCI9546823.1 ABC transporter permease [Lachnospiraceae bacterium]